MLNRESLAEQCHEPLVFAGIVDIWDEQNPRLISTSPVPRPSRGLDFTHYCDKGGRFGPHNTHLPRHSRGVGHFVPPDPAVQIGLFPRTALVTQTEDVLVDARGNIYITRCSGGEGSSVRRIRQTGKLQAPV